MKKRWISLLLVFVMVTAMMPQVAIEARAVQFGTCGDNLTWVLDNEGTLTIRGTGKMTNFGFLDSPFRGNSSIYSIIIENGVTSIGSYAVLGCDNLTSVTIPSSVTSIGDSAFIGCNKLSSVTIPNSVTSIGDEAFSYCSSLIGIWVDVKNPAFSNDADGVLFNKNQTELMQVPGATSGSYVVPSSVTSIGNGAFSGCRKLSGVTIPSSVTFIGDGAFSGCNKLSSVTIPNSVTSIGDSAFLGCTGLTRMTIPNSVTSIGGGAFIECDSLTSVTISSSVISIGDEAFAWCPSLTGIWVDADNPSYSSDAAGVLFNKNQTELIQAPGAIRGSYVVPNSVTSIGGDAFILCNYLTSVTISSRVTSIGDFAFAWCDYLTSVTIPSSITSIGIFAFDDCKNLTDVYYPGTEAQWSQIDIGTDNECLTNATIHFGASSPNWDTYVDLNADVNAFPHAGMRYQISNALYKANLLSGQDLIRLLVISEQLNNTEVRGYCHGLAASICLGSKGMIDFSSLPSWKGGNADNYYSLLSPTATVPETGRINSKFRDLLTYYQLTQFTTFGQETKYVTNSGLAKEWRLEGFLADLVAEAIRSESKEAPFIFSYRYYDLDINGNHITDNGTDVIHGHSVVVCGYNWNDKTNQHEIQIYDENCSGTRLGRNYYVLSVSEDYSTFSFVDANSRGKRASGYAVYMLEDKWVELKYYGINKVYNFINLIPMPVSTGQSEENATELIISANTSFKITNAEGEYVVYTAGDFSGTMNISDMKLFGSETDPYWVLSVPTSTHLVLTDTSGNCNMVVTIDGNEYSACCDGASSVTFSKEGVIVAGDHVKYNIVMTPSITDVDMVRMTGTSTGNTTFRYSNSQQNISVISNSAMEDIEVYGYTCFSPESVRISESDTYTVVESSEADGAAVVVDDIEMQMSAKINPFTDVPEGSFYYEPVLWAVENSITTGATETTFNPNGECLRAQVVTFLWRAEGCPEPKTSSNPFVDVMKSDFYYKAVLWAVENGITNGADATHFNPMGVCNRAQVVTFLHRAFDAPTVENAANPFTDVPADAWYTVPVLWAVENGITNGLSATQFGPNASCNRAQIVTFLYRAYTE